MRIAFDLRAMQIGHENRGIGMYIRSVLENMPDDDNQYFFYCFEGGNPIKDLEIKTKLNYQIITTPKLKTALEKPADLLAFYRLAFHKFKPLKRHRPEVFLQFDFNLGLPRWRQTKKLVIGYDLIPLILPNDYLPTVRYAWHNSAGKRYKLKAVVRAAYYQHKYHISYKVFKRASKTIAISDATAKDFDRLLGIPSNRLITAPLAAALNNSTPDSKVLSQINKPYVFYIGGTDMRKRIDHIVYAFNIARGRGANVSLVFAGNEFRSVNSLPSVNGRNAILASPYKDDIHMLGFVSDSQKAALYQNAKAFIFCSVYEGFGMPVLEALASGCPVVAYNNSSIPEAAGKAAILVNNGDYVSVGEKVLYDLPKPNEKLVAGQLNKFTWKKHCELLLSCFKK